MSAYNPDPPPKELNAHRCAAEGCPQPGSISVEHGPWCCSYHARTSKSLWGTVTYVINQHLQVGRVVRAATMLSTGEFDQIQSAGAWALPDFLKPKSGENYQHWIHRIIRVHSDDIAEKINEEIQRAEAGRSTNKQENISSWAADQLTNGSLFRAVRGAS